MVTPITPANRLTGDLLLSESADPKTAETLIRQLQQAGSFNARILQVEGQKLLLDTAFGALRGQLPARSQGNAVRLEVGDIIQARLEADTGQMPKLRIEARQAWQQTLRQPALRQQLQELPNPVQVARIVRHDRDHTLLHIRDQSFRIPRQPELKPGDSVLIQPADRRGEIRLQRIHPLPVLRAALARLLPRQDSSGMPATGNGLARLQRLAAEIPGIQGAIARPAAPAAATPAPAAPVAAATDGHTSTETTAATATARAAAAVPSSNPALPAALRAAAQQAGAETQPAPATSPPPVNTSTRAEASPAPSPHSAPAHPAPPTSEHPATGAARQMIHALLRSGIDLLRPAPRQIQRQLAEFGLLPVSPSPLANANAHSDPQLLPRLIELQALLRDQPEVFDRLLRTPGSSASSSASPASAESASTADAAQWRQQFSQQLEQTIHQLLLGKTSLKLQQEQQQPINLNLALPLQLPNEPARELKLRLRERASPDQPEQPAWEVRLSFEFGMLGLITVHVLLQDQRISAHFWAAEETTWTLINAQLPDFRRQLQRSGFEPGLFDCFHGQPRAEDEPPHPGGDNLLDIEV